MHTEDTTLEDRLTIAARRARLLCAQAPCDDPQVVARASHQTTRSPCSLARFCVFDEVKGILSDAASARCEARKLITFRRLRKSDPAVDAAGVRIRLPPTTALTWGWHGRS